MRRAARSPSGAGRRRCVGGGVGGDGEGVEGGEVDRVGDLTDEELTALADLLDRVIPRRDPDVVSHRDVVPANPLTAGGRLVGVLDADGYGPADPALDLVGAWHLLDAEQRERLLQGPAAG